MSLKRRLQRAWDALAGADAGEVIPFEGAGVPREMEPARDYRDCQSARPPRKVAVNLGPGLNQTQLDYATGIAQRLDAELVLMRHPSGADSTCCDEWIAMLEQSGVAFQTELLQGVWSDAVGAYLRRHGEVDFLVVAPDDLPRQAEVSGEAANAQLRFPVPLVVVESRDAAAREG